MEENKEIKKVTTKKNTKSKVGSEKTIEEKDKELEELKNEMKLLKEMLLKNKTEQKQVIQNEQTVKTNTSEKLELTDIITVYSLVHYPLVLTTEKYGGGTPYEFNEFGDSQPIPYADLIKIIQIQSRFAREGYFYIANEKFVRIHSLEKCYKNIVNPKTIETLFELDNEDIVNIFKNSTEAIKETIVHKILDKIVNNNEYVDMNIIYQINSFYDKDILKMINDSKETKSLKENNK